MQPQHSLSSFFCAQHPTEPVQRVSLDRQNTHSLYCVECLVSEQSPINSSSLITLPTLVDKAQAHYAQYGLPKPVATAAPNYLVEFLSQETQTVDRVSVQIDKEKTKITEGIDQLITNFTDLLQKKKLHLHVLLDQQLTALKTNYAYYKATLSRFYNDDNHSSQGPTTTKEAIMDHIGSLHSVEYLDVYVKRLKDDIADANVTHRDHDVANKLESLSEAIIKQSTSLPHIEVKDNQGTDWMISLKEKVVHVINQQLLIVADQIPAVTMQTVSGNAAGLKQGSETVDKYNFEVDTNCTSMKNFRLSNENKTITRIEAYRFISCFGEAAIPKTGECELGIRIDKTQASCIGLGVCPGSKKGSYSIMTETGVYCYYGYNEGSFCSNGVTTNLTNAKCTSDSIISMLVDIEARTIKYKRDGVIFFEASLTHLDNEEYYPFIYFYNPGDQVTTL